MIEGWTLLSCKNYNYNDLKYVLYKAISESRLKNNYNIQNPITIKIVYTMGLEEEKEIYIPYCMEDIEEYASRYAKEILDRDYELLKAFFKFKENKDKKGIIK